MVLNHKPYVWLSALFVGIPQVHSFPHISCLESYKNLSLKLSHEVKTACYQDKLSYPGCQNVLLCLKKVHIIGLVKRKMLRFQGDIVTTRQFVFLQIRYFSSHHTSENSRFLLVVKSEINH